MYIKYKGAHTINGVLIELNRTYPLEYPARNLYSQTA